MNSVYDRPLFANRKQKRRDARTKLLNMGGIVASSPELMQAVNQAPRSMNQGGYVAGYENGGLLGNNIANTFNPMQAILERFLGAQGLGTPKNEVIQQRKDDFEELKNKGFLDLIVSDLPGAGGVDVSKDAGTVTTDNSATNDGATDNDANRTKEVDARQAELFAETRQKLADAELLLKNKNLSEDAKADAAADLVNKGLQGTDKERTAQYKDLIEDVFGKKASANTIKGLNKQLIGFTIAAGKSPRAVQNIAAGMIAGAKTEKADIAKEQERTDAMSTLALNQMFSEKAASELAASNLAVAKARGTGEQKSRQEIIYGTTFQSFVNSMQDANQRARDNFQTPPYTDEEIIATARRAAMDAAPGSISAKADIEAGRGATVDVSKTPGTAKLQTITTREEYDALKPGEEFIQNGQKRKKPLE